MFLNYLKLYYKVSVIYVIYKSIVPLPPVGLPVLVLKRSGWFIGKVEAVFELGNIFVIILLSTFELIELGLV